MERIKTTIDITYLVNDIYAYLARFYPPEKLLGMPKAKATALVLKLAISRDIGKEAELEELKRVARGTIEKERLNGF